MKRMPNMTGRTARLAINVVGNFGSRAINLFAAVLIVPMAVSGLGVLDYSIFAVILSAATFITYADFGMGLAMVNPITVAEAKDDHAAARKIISQTWGLMLLIAGTVMIIGFIIVAIVGTRSTGGQMAMLPWFVFVACVSVALPTAITQRVLFALERNFEANIWLSVGRVASLGGVYAAYLSEAGLAAYILAMIGLPGLVGWINTAKFFLKDRPDLAPRIQPSLAAVRRLLPNGLRYVVMQVGPYIEVGFDIILIRLFIGPEMTTSYDLVSRAFNYVPALAMIGVLPLWPAISAAIAKGDHLWARKVERLSDAFVLAGTITQATILVLFYTQIIKLWTGHSVELTNVVVLSLAFVAVSVSYLSLKSAIIVAAEGADRLSRAQLTLLLFLLPIKIFALHTFGINGLAASTALLYIPKNIWILYIFRTRKTSPVSD